MTIQKGNKNEQKQEEKQMDSFYKNLAKDLITIQAEQLRVEKLREQTDEDDQLQDDHYILREPNERLENELIAEQEEENK